MTYTFIPAVGDQLEIPDDGTLRRTLYGDNHLRVVGFAFDKGQELRIGTPMYRLNSTWQPPKPWPN